MQAASSVKHIGTQVRTEITYIKSLNKACALAVAAAFAFATGTTFAYPSPAVKEDSAQLKADEKT